MPGNRTAGAGSIEGAHGGGARMTFALGIAIGVAAVLAALLIFRSKPESQDPAVAQLRLDVQSLRASTEGSVQNFTALTSQLQQVTQKSLADATSQLGTRLDSINRQVTEQLNQSASVMNASANVVSERVADVQNTFAGLQKQVGEMTAQARQLSDLSKSVTAIEHVLRAPKMRGNFGEEQLETLLGLVFARQQFVLQHRFSSGEVADALLLLPPGNVAVDSKFPLENFRRISENGNEDERRSTRREFLRDVR